MASLTRRGIIDPDARGVLRLIRVGADGALRQEAVAVLEGA